MSMIRPTGVVVMLLAVLFLSAPAASAQAPAASFGELDAHQLTGQRVIVRQRAGRPFHGRLVSVAGNQIEVERIRWFRRQRQTFVEGEVRRIDYEDSIWDGFAKGAAVGLASAVTFAKLPACNTPDNFTCLPPLALSVPLGIVIGEAIDRAVNRPVFEPPTGASIALSPLVGRGRSGVALTVRF
jgi:hypothetical protein